MGADRRFFIFCERDAGMFSLLQQVVSNLPRALNAQAIPIVRFGRNCAYWNPAGYAGAETVWEAYFEPLLPNFPASSVPHEVGAFADDVFPDGGTIGTAWDSQYYLSNNFGDHPCLRHEVLVIPYEWADPDAWTREVASRLFERFIRPRDYLLAKAQAFAEEHLDGHPVIGVHLRGTDALSAADPRLFHHDFLKLDRYVSVIRDAQKRMPGAKILVATDADSSLEAMRAAFGEAVVSYATIRHAGGEPAGKGPTGALMPAYFAGDPARAAKNAEEALVEFLLLRRSQCLVHNGGSLARSVLLAEPSIAHHNTHRLTASIFLRLLTPRRAVKLIRMIDERLRRRRKIRFAAWERFLAECRD